MEVAVLAAVAFAINKTVSVIKGLRAADWNLVITQVVVWLVGWAAMFLLSQASLTEGFIVPAFDTPFQDLDAASLFLMAWLAGSTGSFAFDFKKAVDGTDSSVEPSLVP